MDLTDDDLIRIYEAALGPLHNPTADWLADALVWIRRIITAETLEDGITAAAVWTGEPEREVADLATALRTHAGKLPPPPEPPAPADPRIVSARDLPFETFGKGRNFASRYQRLGEAAGGVKLGCSLYEVAPGKRAFPFHAHHGTEEAIFILAGEGTLRLGDGEHVVGAGTYAAFPPGADAAHQLINTGTTTLRYLCLSSKADPDVVVYPDSGKTLASAGGDSGVRIMAKFVNNLGYWDGEDVG